MIELLVLLYIASLIVAVMFGWRSGIRGHQKIVYENGWKSIWREQKIQARAFDRILAAAKDIRDACEDSTMSGDEYQKVLTALDVIESGGYDRRDRHSPS